MTHSKFPPQAYTSETLKHAFDWLSDQPDSVRQMVKDTDDLVSIYLRSRRHSSANTPSSESFRKDLKDLAEGLRQFEEPKEASMSGPEIEKRVQQAVQANLAEPEPVKATPATPPTPAPASPVQTPVAPRSTATSTATASSSQGLDPQTKQIVAEVRRKLNLSHDAEALRLLVSLGHEKLKPILPS